MGEFGEPLSLEVKHSHIKVKDKRDCCIIQLTKKSSIGMLGTALHYAQGPDENDLFFERVVACLNALSGIEDVEKFVEKAKRLEKELEAANKKIEKADKVVESGNDMVERAREIDAINVSVHRILVGGLREAIQEYEKGDD